MARPRYTLRLALVLGCVAVTLVIGVSTALAAHSFTDPRGDAGDGPDIMAVTLSHTDAVLSVAVRFADAPPLGYSEADRYTDMLLVGIHTDDDLGRDDVEFAAGVHGVDLSRGLVTNLSVRGEYRQAGSADVEVDGTTLTMAIPRTVLGDPDRVAIDVTAGREYVDGEAEGSGGDFAPASGPYPYTLSAPGEGSLVWPLVACAAAAVAIGSVAVLLARLYGRRHPLGLAR